MSSKKIILVEGEQDKQFIDRVRKQLHINGVEILELEVETMGGETNLGNKLLNEIKNAIYKGNLDQLGVIIDMDAHKARDRFDKINNDFLKAGFLSPKIDAQNTFYTLSLADDSSSNCQVGCYLMNHNGQGNLEDILMAICAKNTDFADALQCWRECLTKNGKVVKDSDYKKQWLQFYARYDCCDKKEATQAGKNCTLEKAFEKGSFDLNHNILQDLHSFLNLFK